MRSMYTVEFLGLCCYGMPRHMSLVVFCTWWPSCTMILFIRLSVYCLHNCLFAVWHVDIMPPFPARGDTAHLAGVEFDTQYAAAGAIRSRLQGCNCNKTALLIQPAALCSHKVYRLRSVWLLPARLGTQIRTATVQGQSVPWETLPSSAPSHTWHLWHSFHPLGLTALRMHCMVCQCKVTV